jgi:GDP-L-fucose synthase
MCSWRRRKSVESWRTINSPHRSSTKIWRFRTTSSMARLKQACANFCSWAAARQPLKEEYLLTGPLEETNQWYAIAKIAGIKMCQAYRRQHGCDFISAMPTNMYGPNDNYDLQNSHVLPALIRKFHEAKTSGTSSVTCWGSGEPFREFLYADDLARACIFLMQHYSEEQFINVGYGSDVSIRRLAEMIRSIVGFKGDIVWDTSKPDGTPRKLMDSSRLFAMGWKPEISLEMGLQLAYDDFLRNQRKDEPAQTA